MEIISIKNTRLESWRFNDKTRWKLKVICPIKLQDRNFTFISQIFNNQYYSLENNIPSYSQNTEINKMIIDK